MQYLFYFLLFFWHLQVPLLSLYQLFSCYTWNYISWSHLPWSCYWRVRNLIFQNFAWERLIWKLLKTFCRNVAEFSYHQRLKRVSFAKLFFFLMIWCILHIKLCIYITYCIVKVWKELCICPNNILWISNISKV